LSLFPEHSVIDIWHQRLGHIGINRLRSIAISTGSINVQESKKDLKFCEGCAHGKQQRLNIGKGPIPRAPGKLHLITSDLCGPFPESLAKHKYFITFTDSFSRRTVVAFLQQK